MKLIDSNIIIYSLYPEYAYLRKQVSNEQYYFSEISLIEVLGFPELSSEEQDYFQSIFYVPQALPVNREVVDKAIEIRKKKRLKLGDALIAATALVYDLVVVTRNEKDFVKVGGLQVENPIR